MCEVIRGFDHAYQSESTTLVTFDVNPAFGIPGFKITHPKDTVWNQ